MVIAGDTLASRRADEVEYIDANSYGMRVARMDAHGGWLASATDLVRFGVNVDNILSAGSWRATYGSHSDTYTLGWSRNSHGIMWHSGSLPGTSSILVRAVLDGDVIVWAAIANTRDAGIDVDGMMWTVFNTIK